MGIIKSMISSAATAIGEGLQDQFLEVIEPEDMGEQTVMTRGVQMRKGRGGNRRGNDHIISNGSVIHVYDSQFMILTDGGRIIAIQQNRGIIRLIIPVCLLCITESWGML